MNKTRLILNIRAIFDYDSLCHSIVKVRQPQKTMAFDKSVEKTMMKFLDTVKPRAYSIDICKFRSESTCKDARFPYNCVL